jgi:hypothetical protein
MEPPDPPAEESNSRRRRLSPEIKAMSEIDKIMLEADPALTEVHIRAILQWFNTKFGSTVAEDPSFPP